MSLFLQEFSRCLSYPTAINQQYLLIILMDLPSNPSLSVCHQKESNDLRNKMLSSKCGGGEDPSRERQYSSTFSGITNRQPESNSAPCSASQEEGFQEWSLIHERYVRKHNDEATSSKDKGILELTTVLILTMKK